MSHRINIELEPTKGLTTREELALIKAAFTRNPSPEMRRRLASLLMADDDNQAIVSLLAERPGLSVREEMLLAAGWLAQETTAGDEAAHAAAERALASSDYSAERAAVLALRAKTETRLGDIAAARATLHEALALDPHNRDACKRLAALALADDDPDTVLKLYDDLAAQGAAHSRLFVAKALAHARRKEDDAVRAVMGADRFFRAQILTPPPGWDTIETFNAALAEELAVHPELRFDRYGAASELTWRIDTPLNRAAPLVRALLDHLAKTMADYAEQLGEADHPWLAARPSDATLRAWCVITESQGFENWHVHQFGWLSGAYYVRVPDSIAHGQSEAGCIMLGLPEDLAGEAGAAAYGRALIRPQSGLLLMFPSHIYHRTFPHGAGDRRICVAFDLKPRKSADGASPLPG